MHRSINPQSMDIQLFNVSKILLRQRFFLSDRKRTTNVLNENIILVHLQNVLLHLSG